jgi:hypothetical protein
MRLLVLMSIGSKLITGNTMTERNKPPIPKLAKQKPVAITRQ